MFIAKLESTKFPCTLGPHTCTASPPQHPTQRGPFVTTDKPTLTHPNHQKFIVYIRVHSWCIFMGFDKCIAICIHHYSITQNSFTALKIICVLPVPLSLPLPSPTRATTDPFTVSIVLFFSECHTVGIMWYVAFQIGFFH